MYLHFNGLNGAKRLNDLNENLARRAVKFQ
jgi:hypothetical protein